MVSIYTDSQAANDGLRLCASSSYSNSYLYYKNTNFELWAITIFSKHLTAILISGMNQASALAAYLSFLSMIAAIHNNFVQKFRKRIWNPRSYEKSRWENAMNITLKVKTTSQPSNLPKSTYLVPYSSLQPSTLDEIWFALV
uniref:Uncharacterized protein n=1 Tax=Rhizophagus irregularis (strain DAOM 181602 / DAOM 197198 / MUCL 43194) TaxID=747089 RepID=U9TBR8_RHIID